MNRQTLLQYSFFSLALPTLESFGASQSSHKAKAKRLICVGTSFGVHTPNLFPEKTGFDYEITPLLKPLENHRKNFSVFSGLDHRAANGHKHWKNYLTGNEARSISLDQIVAKKLGEHTRFSSLELSAGRATERMCFADGGSPLPMIERPSVVYHKLFGQGEDKDRTAYLLDSGKSALDFAMGQMKSLKPALSHRDHHKVEEYFASIRGVEKKLEKKRRWLEVPLKSVSYTLPKVDPISPELSLECEGLMYDLMELALLNDSTRVISLLAPGSGQVFQIEGQTLSSGYHGLSHHGNDPRRVGEFVKVNREHLRHFAEFVDRLSQHQDLDGRSLLDSSIVMFGSGMGDSNIHDNSNLPIVVAGGGFKHGQHFHINRKAKDGLLLGDLYISFMRQLGLREGSFANANRGFGKEWTA